MKSKKKDSRHRVKPPQKVISKTNAPKGTTKTKARSIKDDTVAQHDQSKDPNDGVDMPGDLDDTVAQHDHFRHANSILDFGGGDGRNIS